MHITAVFHESSEVKQHVNTVHSEVYAGSRLLQKTELLVMLQQGYGVHL
jgi:hypothetical protein